IQAHRLDTERMQTAVLDRSTTEVLAGALQSGSTSDILYALGLLADRDVPESVDAVRPLVDHPDPAVRRKAIALLAAANDAQAATLMASLPAEFGPELVALLKDPSFEVARLALRAAAAMGAVSALRETLADDTPGRSVLRAEIPAVLQRIATPDAEQALVEHL